ncbi:MAG: DUF615 domain-containing protein [Pseudomonadales bacterium]|nr:DUF615 domain-containing protein [Pseudomonadales bacterium]
MTEDNPEIEQKPSRSSRKRDALALQTLGTDLLKLPADQFKLISVSETLKTAINDYHRIRTREAKRRQSQFIGRLMRDEDIDSIHMALSDLQQTSAAAQYQHHQLEGWRDKLLTQPNALTEYLNEYPHTDRQQLRTLIRQALSSQSKSSRQKDSQQNQQAKPDKKHLRALFRFLRDSQNPD